MSSEKQRYHLAFVQIFHPFRRFSSAPLVALLLTLSVSLAHACDNEVYGIGSGSSGERSGSGLSAKGDPMLASSGHNVGIYYYNPSTGTSQLVQSYYDSSASSWAFNPGYVVQSDSSFAGSGTNSSD